MDARQRMQTAITVAKMYYIDGISQDEIAQKTDMSRSNISRILKKCISSICAIRFCRTICSWASAGDIAAIMQPEISKIPTITRLTSYSY